MHNIFIINGNCLRMKNQSTLFLEKIPKKTKEEIELWYKISSTTLILLFFSLSLITAKKYSLLSSKKKEYKLKNIETTELNSSDSADSQALFSPEIVAQHNKNFLDSFVLICDTIPDEMVLSSLVYTTANTILKGSCSSTEIVSNFTQELTKNNFYTHAKVIKIEKKDIDFIFEIMLF